MISLSFLPHHCKNQIIRPPKSQMLSPAQICSHFLWCRCTGGGATLRNVSVSPIFIMHPHCAAKQESCSTKMGDDHGDNMSTEPRTNQTPWFQWFGHCMTNHAIKARCPDTPITQQQLPFKKHQFSSKFVNCTCWSASPMASGTNPIMTAMWNSDLRSSTNDYVVPMAMAFMYHEVD